MNPPPLEKRKKRPGFINPRKVRVVTFVVVNTCLAVSIFASLLAIWDFAQQDVLWRTVATCIVLATGMIFFTGINQAFGKEAEE